MTLLRFFFWSSVLIVCGRLWAATPTEAESKAHAESAQAYCLEPTPYRLASCLIALFGGVSSLPPSWRRRG
jgi:hypothetical protein